ncbi:dynein regulatory complex protein 10 [Trachinotus anak]|uniref:dynein regulatory complex protein 10 n=1 Tax=Trachinotus anak TaxID=443729 RepID=UPI0039F1915C
MFAKGPIRLVKHRSVDALKDHDLSQKKQLSFEAQRISSVLENCISQIEIVAALPAILHLNSSSSVVDEELSRALQMHQLLVERLEESLKQESEDGEDGEARKRAKARLEKDIKNSVRDLLRLIRAHPGDIFGFRERGMEVGESEYKLIRGLKMFHSQMVVKLLTSLEEDLQLVLYKPASPSPAHSLEHMALMEEEVATSEKETDAKISQKKILVKNLQCSLQGKNTQEAGMSLAAEQCQQHVKISKKQTSMKQEIDQLTIQLNNLIIENRQAERVLQEKYEKVETEIEYLLYKFDNEIEENQADLELNEVDNEKEEEELRRLEKPFSVLEEECNQVQERRRLAEEKREKEIRELELKTKAAIFAQAWWRGYSTRKALMNKGKSKKAKKGKGKKK